MIGQAGPIAALRYDPFNLNFSSVGSYTKRNPAGILTWKPTYGGNGVNYSGFGNSADIATFGMEHGQH